MRVITRADLDGIVCAVVLKRMVDVSGGYLFTEAFPLQKGEIEVREGDVICNLPYRNGCTLWFDHHASNEPETPLPGKWALTPSAARIVFDYYRCDKIDAFEAMIIQTDRVDSADITPEEIADPSGFFLLELTINPKKFDDEPYWLHLIELLDRTDGNIVEILKDPDCARRAKIVLDEVGSYRKLIEEKSTLYGNVVVSDLRGVKKLPAENRFLVYGLFPKAEVSVKLAEVSNEKGHFVKISLGRSIVNTKSTINLGDLLAGYGGGGHAAAGSVHVPYGEEDPVFQSILTALTAERW